MNFGILSYYKCGILSYLLLYMFRVITCFQTDINNDDINSTRKHNNKQLLFEENHYWNEGDIPTLNKKVFKGMRVAIREHPYVASIRRNFMHYSVATMLTKNLFVTVAHPLIDVPLYELGIVVGENYADRGATLLTVLLVIVHEAFDKYTLAADIALLRVFEDLSFRCSVKVIQLMDPRVDLNKKRAFVTGWGRCDRTGTELCLPRSGKYTPGEKFDPMLRTVSFVLNQPNPDCDEYKRNGVILKAGMLCAGQYRQKQKIAPCMAVPGAPMVVGGHLTGILSWGFGCGYDYDLPLIYTNVVHFQQWLVHNFKIFRGITTKNLTLFFEATRASRLAMWLKLTRIEPPTPFVVPNKPMEIMQIDKILARLRGRVLDIRDYLYDGIHRTYKRKLYEKIRGMMYMKKTTHANFTYNPLEPFLNPIITQNMDNVTTSKPAVTLNVADSDFDEY